MRSSGPSAPPSQPAPLPTSLPDAYAQLKPYQAELDEFERLRAAGVEGQTEVFPQARSATGEDTRPTKEAQRFGFLKNKLGRAFELQGLISRLEGEADKRRREGPKGRAATILAKPGMGRRGGRSVRNVFDATLLGPVTNGASRSLL